MGFSQVPDRSAGDIFTEAMWDTYIKDNFNTGVPVQLANTTLGASAASISFTGISGNWAHLQLIGYVRGDTASTAVAVLAQFNADTGSNYDCQYIFGSGASAAAAESLGTTAGQIGTAPGASGTANVFSIFTMDIPFYSGTSGNKNYSAQWSHKHGTSTGNLQAGMFSGSWRSSSAITQVTIFPGAGNFVSGSRITLYGMP